LVNDQSRASNCINYLGKILGLLSKNVFELIGQIPHDTVDEVRCVEATKNLRIEIFFVP